MYPFYTYKRLAGTLGLTVRDLVGRSGKRENRACCLAVTGQYDRAIKVGRMAVRSEAPLHAPLRAYCIGELHDAISDIEQVHVEVCRDLA